MAKSKIPKISVIIPAYNEEKYILKTLKSVKAQSFKDFESIVVANNCTDNTVKVSNGKCDLVIETKRRGQSLAMNIGARKAKGEIFVFLDADTEISANTFERISRVYRKRDYVAVMRTKPDVKEFSFLAVYFFKNLAHKTKLWKGHSGVTICSKKTFNKVGGFDEKLKIRKHSKFIKKARKYVRYKQIKWAYATTSMRRLQKRGIIHLVYIWLKLWVISWFKGLSRIGREDVR